MQRKVMTHEEQLAFEKELGKLQSESPVLQDFLPFIQNFLKESDRGAVLIGLGFIENLLGQILSEYLLDVNDKKELFEGFNAPLGSLSARALTAFSMGLIDEVEYNEINTLKKIRNHFAHDYKESFSDSKTVSHSKNLKGSISSSTTKIDEPVQKFKSSCIQLIIRLLGRPFFVKQRKLKLQHWPIGHLGA